MRIGVIGAGNIGGNAANLLARAGHEVLLSYSRDMDRLRALADEIGPAAKVGTPAEAAEFGEVVIISVPWRLVGDAAAQAGPLDGKIVIDTTNQFGRGLEPVPSGLTALQYNATRIPGARLVKSFNTLTAGFQASAAGRTGSDRVVMFYAGDDAEAKAVVARLIEDAGFAAVDLGSAAEALPMEAPRRPGGVYGEEYHLEDARAYVEAVRTGGPLPGPSVPD